MVERMTRRPLRVLVCGSRTWTSELEIRSVLKDLPRDTTVIHGGADGADRLAGVVARSMGMRVEEYPANWKSLGRRAGFLRNLQMLDQKPDFVLAFWDGVSKGTKHTIDQARKRNIPVIYGGAWPL